MAYGAVWQREHGSSPIVTCDRSNVASLVTSADRRDHPTEVPAESRRSAQRRLQRSQQKPSEMAYRSGRWIARTDLCPITGRDGLLVWVTLDEISRVMGLPGGSSGANIIPCGITPMAADFRHQGTNREAAVAA